MTKYCRSGSITAGLAIYDSMQFINCDVATYCVGQCASMGAVLLCAGAPGKRKALPNSRIMIHQPMAGMEGSAEDIMIHAKEFSKVKERLNSGLRILGILPTFYDGRTRHAREVVEELSRLYKNMITEVIIPTTIKFADTSTAGESILTFSSSSPGAQAYRKLAKEVRDGKTG